MNTRSIFKPVVLSGKGFATVGVIVLAILILLAVSVYVQAATFKPLAVRPEPAEALVSNPELALARRYTGNRRSGSESPSLDARATWLARREELTRIKDEIFPVDARATWLARREELTRIKDEIFPVDTRAARQARQIELARIKDEMFPVDSRAARLARMARLAELAEIKDAAFWMDTRAAKQARQVELARIKDDGLPVDARAAKQARQIELAHIKDEGFGVDTRLGGAPLALAGGTMTTDAIAGTWYGNMHFSGLNVVERIKVAIPAGCEPGSVCGSMLNYPVQCTWEITYDGFSGGAYQYHFSGTLMGGCPSGSAGSLTLQADGSLYRVHRTPVATATGILKQRPEP